MIAFLDHFVDTREKRYYALLLLTVLVLFLMIIPNLLLGITLLSLDDYDSLFNILSNPVLDMTYVSRSILDIISKAQIQVIEIIKILVHSVRWYEGMAIVLLVMTYSVWKKKKVSTFCFVTFYLEIIILVFLMFYGLQATSLSRGILALRGIGITFLVFQGMHAYLCIRYGIRLGKKYGKALQYEVEEIKEHRDV